MFNPMETNENDVKQLFEYSAIPIKINGKKSKGFVTEYSFFRETEDKNIHTLDKLQAGDYITYQDKDYLIMNETITKRHHKYKALMRYCNFHIARKNVICEKFVGENSQGIPIYENVYGDDYIVPVIYTRKTYSIDERHALRIVSDQISLHMQDSDLNRTMLFPVNSIFTLDGKQYSVLVHENNVQGLLTLGAESTTSSETIPKPEDGYPTCE